MLKISIHAKAKCRKHPKFDPMHGEAAIKGGCITCHEIMDLWILARAAAKTISDRLDRIDDPNIVTEWRE